MALRFGPLTVKRKVVQAAKVVAVPKVVLSFVVMKMRSGTVDWRDFDLFKGMSPKKNLKLHKFLI